MEAEAEAEAEMGALKMAYADIILNTAKESAARILASERRALRFRQALFAAKEEALATMLRLKTITDAKIKEAEMTSLSQVKRIQELEVQLNEAEHTIGSLREELESVSNELKKMTNDSVESLNMQKANGHATSDNGKCLQSHPSSASNLRPLVGPGSGSAIYIKGTTLCQKNKDIGHCFTGNAVHAESLKDLHAEKECGNNPDLASIIMRSQEPELYRNGCTQRIRAFEHNVLAVKAPNEESDGQLLDSMNDCTVSENEKLDKLHTLDSAKTVKTVTHQAKNSSECEGRVQPSSNCGNGHSVILARRLSPRKPRTKCFYLKSNDHSTSQNQDPIRHEPSDIKGSKIESGAILVTKSISEEPPHKLLKSQSAPISSVICEGEEYKRLGLNRISSNDISCLLPCNNRNVNEQIGMKQNHPNSQNAISQSFAYDPKNNEHGNSIKDPMLSTTEMQNGVLLTGPEDNDEVLLQTDDSKLTPADQNMGGNLDVLDAKDDLPVRHLNSKAESAGESSGALPQVGKDKFLKYTFQRTRKRGSSSSKNESISPETVTGKRKSADKQNILPESHKPTSDTELPRNDRRLMQVARQLISLSEKRW